MDNLTRDPIPISYIANLNSYIRHAYNPSKPAKIKSRNIKGFTLVELLIAVVVITILAGVLIKVVNPGGISAKGRDGKRSGDLATYQAALEIYFADNLAYPASDDVWIPAHAIPGFAQYITDPPQDSKGTGSDPCTDPTEYGYYYITRNNGSSYVLATLTEVETSNDDHECQDLANWNTNWCGDPLPTNSVCFGVESPGGAPAAAAAVPPPPPPPASVVVNFEDWVVCCEPNKWVGWEQEVTTTFTVPSDYENYGTLVGWVAEGHPWECMEGYQNPTPDGDSTESCDQLDPIEEVEFYLNSTLCHTHTDKNPEDDCYFNVSVVCNGVQTGDNELRAVGVGIPEPGQFIDGVLEHAPVGSVDFNLTFTVEPL